MAAQKQAKKNDYSYLEDLRKRAVSYAKGLQKQVDKIANKVSDKAHATSGSPKGYITKDPEMLKAFATIDKAQEDIKEIEFNLRPRTQDQYLEDYRKWNVSEELRKKEIKQRSQEISNQFKNLKSIKKDFSTFETDINEAIRYQKKLEEQEKKKKK